MACFNSDARERWTYTEQRTRTWTYEKGTRMPRQEEGEAHTCALPYGARAFLARAPRQAIPSTDTNGSAGAPRHGSKSEVDVSQTVNPQPGFDSEARAPQFDNPRYGLRSGVIEFFLARYPSVFQARPVPYGPGEDGIEEDESEDSLTTQASVDAKRNTSDYNRRAAVHPELGHGRPYHPAIDSPTAPLLLVIIFLVLAWSATCTRAYETKLDDDEWGLRWAWLRSLPLVTEDAIGIDPHKKTTEEPRRPTLQTEPTPEEEEDKGPCPPGQINAPSLYQSWSGTINCIPDPDIAKREAENHELAEDIKRLLQDMETGEQEGYSYLPLIKKLAKRIASLYLRVPESALNLDSSKTPFDEQEHDHYALVIDDLRQLLDGLRRVELGMSKQEAERAKEWKVWTDPLESQHRRLEDALLTLERVLNRVERTLSKEMRENLEPLKEGQGRLTRLIEEERLAGKTASDRLREKHEALKETKEALEEQKRLHDRCLEDLQEAKETMHKLREELIEQKSKERMAGRAQKMAYTTKGNTNKSLYDAFTEMFVPKWWPLVMPTLRALAQRTWVVRSVSNLVWLFSAIRQLSWFAFITLGMVIGNLLRLLVLGLKALYRNIDDIFAVGTRTFGYILWCQRLVVGLFWNSFSGLTCLCRWASRARARAARRRELQEERALQEEARKRRGRARHASFDRDQGPRPPRRNRRGRGNYDSDPEPSTRPRPPQPKPRDTDEDDDNQSRDAGRQPRRRQPRGPRLTRSADDNQPGRKKKPFQNQRKARSTPGNSDDEAHAYTIEYQPPRAASQPPPAANRSRPQQAQHPQRRMAQEQYRRGIQDLTQPPSPRHQSGRNTPNTPQPSGASPQLERRGPPVCQYCGKPGHTTGNCWHLWRYQETLPPPQSHPVQPQGGSSNGNTSDEAKVGSVHLPPPGIEQEFAFDFSPRNRELRQLETDIRQEDTAAAEPAQYHVQGRLNNWPQKHSLLIDTGSSVNVLPKRACMKMGLQISGNRQGTKLVSYRGDGEAALGSVQLPVQIGTGERVLEFLVSPRAQKVILGLDGIRKFGFVLNARDASLQAQNGDKVFCYALHSNSPSSPKN